MTKTNFPPQSSTVSISKFKNPNIVSQNNQSSWWKSRVLRWGVGLVVSFVFLFWLASSVVPKVLLYLTKATSRPGNFSLANSYVFASPLVAAADGEEKIRVNVFLLDDKGKGVPDKTVSLFLAPKGGEGGTPQVISIQPQTNDYGQAIFDLTSTFPGQFIVEAQISGLSLPQTVTVTFK